MLDRTDLKLSAQIPHPAGFQLEYPDSLRLIEQIVRLRVIKRQVVDRDINALGALDQFACVTNDRERLQSKEIHFEQPEIADRAHRVLRHDGAVLIFFERQQIDEWFRSDDHARRVYGSVAR